MIKHFKNKLELVPLLDHNNEHATYAFLGNLLNRFGISFEILNDQDT
jgi:hypothetical protein